jgi:hypothetical protein
MKLAIRRRLLLAAGIALAMWVRFAVSLPISGMTAIRPRRPKVPVGVAKGWASQPPDLRQIGGDSIRLHARIEELYLEGVPLLSTGAGSYKATQPRVATVGGRRDLSDNFNR